MTQILGIKLSDHGPVCYFASGSYVVEAGQAVLVDTDQGIALGRVLTLHTPEEGGESSPMPAPPLVTVAMTSGPAPFAESFEDGFGEALWAPFSAPAVAQQAAADSAAPPAAALVEGAAPIAAPGAEAVKQVPGINGPAAVDLTQPQVRPKSAVGLARIVRLAETEDLEIAAENRLQARKAHNYCRGCINDLRLDMKLVDVEVLHDRGKMIFYFTAPGRIDFRELIKSLVREFHTRIELRQIGVRHETQMLGAIGNCGQVCCCRRFLRKFAPVTIKMAKEQNLFLNPAKISGICGRLLCCLSYEQKGYEEFHKQCPKIGKRFQTVLGSLKVLRANFFKKSVSVWLEEGGEREFTLEEWRELLARQPGDGPPPEAEVKPGSERNGRSDGGRQRQERPRSDRPERTERPRPDKPRSEKTRAENARVESARVESARVEAAREEAAAQEGRERPAGETTPRPPREPRTGGRSEARPEGRPDNRSEGRAEGRTEAIASAAEPRAEGQAPETEGEARERQRPRRKRRRPKGNKPAS